MNAKVGDMTIPNKTCGIFGLGEQNNRGEKLIDFCSANNMLIANSTFEHHPRHLYTWASPDSRIRKQIDFFIINQEWKSCVKNVKTKPGADCKSDHQLLAMNIQIRLKKLPQPPRPIRFDYQTMDINYNVKVSNSFETSTNSTEPPPLLEEIKDAIKDLKIRKSPGNDQVTAEMIKYGGENVEVFYHRLCTKIRHSSKILLKIITKQMASKLNEEIATEQVRFRPGKGTRDQIMNLKMILEKNRERGIDVFLCFIDYSKAFDTVAHDNLWNNMYTMGFPTHIILLLKSMYEQQTAAVRTTYGLTDWFDIEQGVRQGCIISSTSTRK
ncbi:uncharacterized protein LOC134764980 [Penaeus indicus]|uniref:uncharacterized protein LOC134764980 n=1 Tax=Penaeus indicus TaxID=29960 RepID=UPI00300CB063